MIQARNLVPAIGNYSTSEQNTGFTWIDGKSIYKKTIKYTGGISMGADVEIPHGISNFNRCLKIEAFGAGGADGQGNTIVMPAINGNNTAGLTFWTVSTTKIKASARGISYHDPIYFTLYYIKTS